MRSSFVFVIVAYLIHQTSVCVLLIPIIYRLVKIKGYKTLILIGYLGSLVIRIIGPSALFAPFLSIIPKYRVLYLLLFCPLSQSIEYICIRLHSPRRHLYHIALLP